MGGSLGGGVGAFGGGGLSWTTSIGGGGGGDGVSTLWISVGGGEGSTGLLCMMLNGSGGGLSSSWTSRDRVGGLSCFVSNEECGDGLSWIT